MFYSQEPQVDIYTSVFTPEELAGLVAFYRTPTGRAFAEKQPALTVRSEQASYRRGKKPRMNVFQADSGGL